MRAWSWILGCLVLAACSPEQEARAREIYEREREEVRVALEQAAEGLEREAQALRAKVDQSRGEAREQWQRALEEVEARQALARRKLETLAEVGADAWQELRLGFERAAEELQRAHDSARNPPPVEEPQTR